MGRPASESGDGWVVVDVETSGFRPGHAPHHQPAALALDAEGQRRALGGQPAQPGVDPAPPMHGSPRRCWRTSPPSPEIADEVIELLHGARWSPTTWPSTTRSDHRGRTGRRTALPIDTVMCTVELARRAQARPGQPAAGDPGPALDISQTRAHDAFDDALVLSWVLSPAPERAREHDIWLPVRPVTGKCAGPTAGSPTTSCGR